MRFTLVMLYSVLILALGDGLPTPQSRIVGGTSAALGEFPFMVSLRKDGEHHCGGSIISRRLVITAAHCRPTDFVMTALVGSNSRDSGIMHSIKTFIAHPNYNSKSQQNDLALVVVQHPFVYSDVVQPIALATFTTDGDEDVTAVGWGLLSYPGVQPLCLQKISLLTITLDQCRMLHIGDLFKTQICTYPQRGEGVCSGDSGGPLLQDGYLIGVTSFAYLCARGMPDFFTWLAVEEYHQWIGYYMELTGY